MKIKVVVHEAENRGSGPRCLPFRIPGCATKGETMYELMHNKRSKAASRQTLRRSLRQTGSPADVRYAKWGLISEKGTDSRFVFANAAILFTFCSCDCTPD